MKACVSIVDTSMDNALRSCERALAMGADMVEIRFDLWIELPQDLHSFERSNIQKIATLRRSDQGGKCDLSDEERLGFFRLAASSNFDYIDIERGSSILKEASCLGPKMICSYHDVAATPSASGIVDIVLTGASLSDVSKAAFMPRSLHDLQQVVQAGQLLRSAEKRFVLISMGAMGEITRACYNKIGSDFTYASIEKGMEAAPGQIDLMTLKGLGEDPVITGITGMPLSHSISPAMHNAAFQALKIPGRYFLLPAERDELEDLIALIVDLDMKGLNVTIPHKQSVMELMDELDGNASKVGAVNTIVNKDGKLIGKNTDITGFARSLTSAGVSIADKRALIIGAGGAARACCAHLSSSSARLFVMDRTAINAERLASEFRADIVGPGFTSDDDFDIVINCTPLGMKGFKDDMPIDPIVFHEGQTVMDLIYNPLRTRFLEEASKKGASTISGIEMLIYQAIDAFEAWTGLRPSYEVMATSARMEIG